MTMLSIVSPAFREARNLPSLRTRLCDVLDTLGMEWEWIIVDDHSPDETFAIVERFAAADRRIRGLRLSRNCGSHQASACGFAHARGDAVVLLAADLQDPPELIPQLLEHWRAGAQVVWAARRTHPGTTRMDRAGGRLFYALLSRLEGLPKLPPLGADFFLIDRVVVDALARFSEQHASLFVLIAWLGFRQVSVDYDKHPRLHGRSGWTLRRKIKLAIDTVVAFSYWPIRCMTAVGLATALAGFAWAAVVVVNALRGAPPSGWASLMVAVLLLGGIQMLMLGVLGEYLWRTLDEARRRPRALIEAATIPPLARPLVAAVAASDRAR